MNRLRLTCSLVALACIAATACSGGDGGQDNPPSATDSGDEAQPTDPAATETNVAPAPCTGDAQCPEGIACIFPNGGSTGICDIAEVMVGDDTSPDISEPSDDAGGVSSAAPAPCMSDADCPSGIACVSFAGSTDGVGFCDVDETVVDGTVPGAGVTSAAPAPCMSDANCPAGIACVSFEGSTDGVGFCDVDETFASDQ